MIQSSGIPVTLVRYGSLFSFFFSKNRPSNLADVQLCDAGSFQKFYQQAFSAGIYLSPSPFEASFLSAAHTDRQLNKTLRAIHKSIKTI